jgi:predicted RNA-binding protein with PUA-like domain
MSTIARSPRRQPKAPERRRNGSVSSGGAPGRQDTGAQRRAQRRQILDALRHHAPEFDADGLRLSEFMQRQWLQDMSFLQTALIVECPAGCRLEAIAAAVGRPLSDFFRDQQNGRQPAHVCIIARYDYRDERGELLYQVVRYDRKDFRALHQILYGSRDKKAVWSGVRNALAQKRLRAIKRGDRIFYYHTGDEKAVVGIAKAVSDPYPDPEDASGKYVAVDVAPVERLARPVKLAEIKADPAFKDFPLVRMARLSVMPVTEAE